MGASLVAASSYEGTATFEASTLVSKGAADTALRFLSTKGAEVTAPVVIADGAAEEFPTSVAASADSIAVSGKYSKAGKARICGVELAESAPTTATNAFVTLLTAAGAPRWVRGLTAGRLESVTLLGDGSVIATGATVAGAMLDGKSVPNAGGEDIFVGHWSKDGALLWSHSVGSPLDDIGGSVVQAADGTVLALHSYRGTIDLGGAITSEGARDLVIARYVP